MIGRLKNFVWWRYYNFKKWKKDKEIASKKTYGEYEIKTINTIPVPNSEIPIDTYDYTDHVFDLLGSGKVKVEYNCQCRGREGIVYLQDRIRPDKEGKFLENIINKGNIEYSKDVWQLIWEIDEYYQPIDWQLDFISGYRWDNKQSIYRLKYGNKIGVDVKVPWELSRFQHLIQMGKMYKKTKDKELLDEFQCQILDFIATNPPYFGVNWLCTMDVAIRAANWVLAFQYFKDNINGDFYDIFYSSLMDHQSFIMNNLENDGLFTSNHYLANISGLFILSLALGHPTDWSDITLFAYKELKNEMKKQVYDDGTDFEGSVFYHRLVTEMFFYPVYFSVLTDQSVEEANYEKIARNRWGDEYIDKLYKMFDAIYYLIKPDGRLPQIGDNDCGYFIKWYPEKCKYAICLLYIGSAFFNEDRWKTKFLNRDWDWDILIVKELFPNIYEEWKSSGWRNDEDVSFTKSFENSGWHIWRKGKDYFIGVGGPVGQAGFGGHSHNHQLSFELMINGKDFIVDSGTYLYTPFPRWRNYFRSVKRHNTVVYDNLEPDPIGKNLFYKPDNSHCETKLSGDTNKWRFEGKHSGYSFDVKVVIEKEDNIIKYTAHIPDKYKDDSYVVFNLHPLVKTHRDADRTHLIYDDTTLTILSQCKPLPSYYSPSYGYIKSTLSLQLPLSLEIMINDNNNLNERR